MSRLRDLFQNTQWYQELYYEQSNPTDIFYRIYLKIVHPFTKYSRDVTREEAY